MASKFKPLTLALVDEGRFLGDINEEIEAGMKALIKFKKKYGKDKALKAKAVIGISLSIVFEGRDENDFSVKGLIKQTVPSKPASVTVAMESEDDAGEATLFVRASGSTADSPKQGVLATKAGDLIDQKTGEVIKEAPAGG